MYGSLTNDVCMGAGQPSGMGGSGSWYLLYVVAWYGTGSAIYTMARLWPGVMCHPYYAHAIHTRPMPLL